MNLSIQLHDEPDNPSQRPVVAFKAVHIAIIEPFDWYPNEQLTFTDDPKSEVKLSTNWEFDNDEFGSELQYVVISA